MHDVASNIRQALGRGRNQARAPGRGVVENMHSTDVEYPPPPLQRVNMSIHPEVTLLLFRASV